MPPLLLLVDEPPPLLLLLLLLLLPHPAATSPIASTATAANPAAFRVVGNITLPITSWWCLTS